MYLRKISYTCCTVVGLSYEDAVVGTVKCCTYFYVRTLFVRNDLVMLVLYVAFVRKNFVPSVPSIFLIN